MAKRSTGGTQAGNSRMSKKGTGKNTFKTNQPVSTTAKPRAKGAAGKGGNWRAGVPSNGQVGRMHQPFNKVPWGRAAAQGSSVANMGDGCSTSGHNTPRGYYSQKEARKGGLMSGTTPLSRTGTKRGKANPAAQVTGPFGW